MSYSSVNHNKVVTRLRWVKFMGQAGKAGACLPDRCLCPHMLLQSMKALKLQGAVLQCNWPVNLFSSTAFRPLLQTLQSKDTAKMRFSAFLKAEAIESDPFQMTLS